MNLFEFAFLADENIHPAVVKHLRQAGFDIATVQEAGLLGAPDTAIIVAAFKMNRVVITHDRDFGALAVARREPIAGIVYLRPGHIQSDFTLATLEALVEAELTLTQPFVLVAVRAGGKVRIRLRRLL